MNAIVATQEEIKSLQGEWDQLAASVDRLHEFTPRSTEGDKAKSGLLWKLHEQRQALDEKLIGLWNRLDVETMKSLASVS